MDSRSPSTGCFKAKYVKFIKRLNNYVDDVCIKSSLLFLKIERVVVKINLGLYVNKLKFKFLYDCIQG